MTPEQIKAAADVQVAEAIAEQRGLHDAQKWAFICDCLQQALTNAYQDLKDLNPQGVTHELT